jgi:signal transduction histidine kinase
MGLAQKLILHALAVALLPLAATGFGLIHIGEDALRTRIGDHQRAAAVAVAAKVSQAVEDLARRVETVMSLVVVTDLTPAERVGVVRMLYRQSDDISVAALIAPDRSLLCQPEYLATDDLTGELAGHPPATERDAVRLVEGLPLPAGGRSQPGAVFLSPAYFPEEREARVAITVPCCFADGEAGAYAGVEVALRRDVLRVEGIDTGEASSVFVVDQRGRVIAHPSVPVGTDLSEQGAVAAFVARRRAETVVFATSQGRFAAATAPVGELGWGVVVQQPEAVAFAAAAAMRRQTLVVILSTAALVLISGLWFAGRLRAVLRRMIAGARAFGEGRLGHRVDVHTRDEIGELGETMNAMAQQLESSLREVEAWGALLETRVEERTRELKTTHAQLLNQSKLAAIGQLGAGVAHEVNNPLAGVLGMVQLMIRDCEHGDPNLSRLREIEVGAKRCKDIIARLLRFSERRATGRMEIDLNEVLVEVVDMVAEGFAEANIEIRLELADDLPRIHADPGQIAQVLVNVLQNAQKAMPGGGRLSVRSARQEGDQVRVEITDTGVGIAPEHLPRIFDPFFTTKRNWTDVGLGLSVAHRIVGDHGGTITAESDVGEGTTFIVALPRVPPESAEEALPLRKTVLLD